MKRKALEIMRDTVKLMSEINQMSEGFPTEKDIPEMREAPDRNPYLTIWQSLGGCKERHGLRIPDMKKAVLLMDARDMLWGTFSLAIPNDPVLEALAALKRPVLDIGCGRGYWAWCLRRIGVVADGYDLLPFEQTWIDVKPSEEFETQVLAPGREDHALMMCWPTEEKFFADAADRSRAKYLIYIGEWGDGCTGGRELNKVLERRYGSPRRVPMVGWPLMKDQMYVCERKRSRDRVAT